MVELMPLLSSVNSTTGQKGTCIIFSPSDCWHLSVITYRTGVYLHTSFLCVHGHCPPVVKDTCGNLLPPCGIMVLELRSLHLATHTLASVSHLLIPSVPVAIISLTLMAIWPSISTRTLLHTVNYHCAQVLLDFLIPFMSFLFVYMFKYV